MGRALSQKEVEQRIMENYAQNVILISEYKNKKTNIILKCLDCGHEWETIAHNAIQIHTGCAKRHCVNCGNGAKKRITLQCAYCGKTIERVPSEIKASKTGFFYCSHECGNLHKNQLRDENGEWSGTSNYRRLAFDNYPHNCAVCGYNEDTRILEVHHIDEDRSNNRLSNLVILCPICHRKITLGYYSLEGASLIKIR